MNTPLLSQSEERRAPWNEREANARFDVVVTQTLRKDTTLSVNAPLAYEGRDEDGYSEVEYDTDNIDWQYEWSLRELDIPDLIAELTAYVIDELAALPKSKDGRTYRRRQHLKHVLDACLGWEVDETYVEQA